jgi:hypothetical protein
MNLIDILSQHEKLIHQKRKNAQDSMVVINQLHLINDMKFEISRFLFWDIRTEEYKLNQFQHIYKKVMTNVVSSFQWLTSRNPNSDLNDMEQWFVKYVTKQDKNDIVGYDNPHVQSFRIIGMNCCVCGNYVHSFTDIINQQHRIFCHCILE